MYIAQLLCIFAVVNIKYAVFGRFSEMLDLSWKFDNDTVYWQGVKPFSYTKKFAGKRDDGLWYDFYTTVWLYLWVMVICRYAMNEFCAGEHGGTHLDAPIHFYQQGLTVADIPLSRLIVPGNVIHFEY